MKILTARMLAKAGLYNDALGFSWRRGVRLVGVVVLDFAAVAGSLALLLRLFGPQLTGGLQLHARFVLQVSTIATLVFLSRGIYRRSWRYMSFTEWSSHVITMVTALSAAWVIVITLRGQLELWDNFLPLAILHLCVGSLAGLMLRYMRRATRGLRRRTALSLSMPNVVEGLRRTLVVGPPEWALSVIDSIKTSRGDSSDIIGVVLTEKDDTISSLGSVPVLGATEDLRDIVDRLNARNRRPENVIVCDDGIHLSKREVAQILRLVRALKLEVSQVQAPWSQLLQRSRTENSDSLPVSELLGRDEFSMERSAIRRQVVGQCVLVTGAGGTIGGELVWQLAGFRPSRLVLLDHAEYNLYQIEMRLRENFPELDIVAELCSIRQAGDVRRVFAKHRPSIVYHAAALKHVPIVEANPCAGVHTNIIGTRIVANAVTEFGVKAMVQVSTDKAVNPVGMMGATKRVGELYSQSLDLCGVDDPDAPRFMTVRFGNVLGSSGSVVPLFQRQLMSGQPLTVTHPDIERFFMTVPEAVQLILESSSRALEEGANRGHIFVLDMGKPVKIVDLARRMARLYGFEPDVDVPIHFTGLRPGEKLYEELFDTCEEQLESGIPGLFEAQSKPIPLPLITKAIDHLALAVAEGNDEEAAKITHNLVKLPSSGVDMTSLFEKTTSFLRGNWPQLAHEG